MARNTSSQLRVSFLVDTGGLRSGFQKATRETDRFGKASTRSARATAGLGSALRGAALAAGGAAAAYISIAQAKQAITTTQELALATVGLQRNLGLATKEASRWAAVTRARGVDSKTLTMSFTALSRAIDGTRTGTESALRPFQALGITQKDLAATGGDFQKQILLVAEALGDAEGSSTRQAAAAKLLGRGYRDILPLFSEGAKGLQEQLKWADEFGATMGKGTVSAMQDFTTAQRRGRVAIMGLQIAFAKFATPAITEAIDGLGEFAAILNDPSLTKAQKLVRLEQQFRGLRDRVISVISDLVPIVAQSAGEIGVALVQGIAKGFQEGSVRDKVFLTGIAVSMFGGPRAIIAAGSTVGALMSRGMAGTMAARTAAMETFAMSRSMPKNLSRGIAVSTVAAAGAAAPVMARSLFASLARAIPVVAGAYAIGDTLLTAIAGDIKGAAIKGGGAAIGGAIGAVIGSVIPGAGTLAGAGIGAGLGTIGANIIQNIVGGAEKEASTMQERIAASVRRLANVADREQGAYRRLQAASDFVVDSRRRQKAATDRVREAEAKLARARAQFGPNSEQAIQAERRLARAKNGVAAANKRVQASERLEAAERQAAKAVAESSVRIVKTEIRQLRRRETAITDTINKRAKQGASDEEIARLGRRQVKISVASEKAQRRLNNIYGRASREIGPKFAGSLRRISGFSAELSGSLRKLDKPIGEVARNTQTSFQRAGNYFQAWADGIRKRTGRVNSNMRSMPKVQTSATERMIQDLQNKIGVIGDLGSPKLNKRRGGLIGGSGRSVMAAVSPGEMITYRGREVMVPGKPEARDSVLMNLPVGAKVFTGDGQMRLAMGASEAQALRDQAPHFATGGIVRPQISGGSPLANRAANRGVGIIHARAQKKYENNMVSDLASVVRLAAKFGLRVSSGYRPGDTGSYHALNRARDFAGDASDMYRFAKFLGTRFGSKLLELIYSPLGWSIDNYQRTAPYAVADHYDHVHVAMRKGGRVPSFRRGGWVKTGFTVFDDPGGGYMGHLQQGNGYAELGTATSGGAATGMGYLAQALGIPGELRDKFPLDVKINGRTKRMYKRDRGYGQGTSAYGIDIYKDTWRYFGLNANSKGMAFIRPAATRKQIEEMQGKADDVLGRVRKSRKNRGAKGYLNAARDNALKARKMAGNGNIWGAADRLRKARKQVKKAIKNRRPTGRTRRPDRDNTPAGDTSYLGLPASVLSRMPFEDRVALLERDLAQAGLTPTSADDLAVLDAQIRLYSGLRARSLKTIAQTNRGIARISPGEIARARKMAKSKNKETRKKGRRLLAKYRRLVSDRSNAISNLGRAESEIASAKEAKGEVGGGVNLAEAMAELAAAIQEQNEIARGVQQTSSREALRLLSDVISGQIVGKRVTSTTPQGVRY